MNALERIGHLHMEAWRAGRAMRETVILECENQQPGAVREPCVNGATDEEACEPCSLERHLFQEAGRAYDVAQEATEAYAFSEDALSAAEERLAFAQLEVDILSGKAGDLP